jgi:hypothetical protein
MRVEVSRLYSLPRAGYDHHEPHVLVLWRLSPKPEAPSNTVAHANDELVVSWRVLLSQGLIS